MTIARHLRHLSKGASWATFALVAVTTLTCRHATPRDERGPGRTAEVRPPRAIPPVKRDDSLEAAERKRFAARIAERLQQVPDPPIVASDVDGADLDNGAFRDRALRLVREVAHGERAVCALPTRTPRPLRFVVWLHHEGARVGRGEGEDERPCVALKDATRRAIASADPGMIDRARIVVDLPDRGYAFTELDGRSFELDHGLVPVRAFDRALLERRLAESERYLLRVIDPVRRGVHKYYHAERDALEEQLHTLYTASTAFTLLKLHARSGDRRYLDLAERAAPFLLEMQDVAPGDPARGAFFYAVDTKGKERDETLVVGTTSKTIFTLLELHAATKRARYLDAALLAADWLTKMQRPDGSVRSTLKRAPSGRWIASTKESLLYTGQVLSALSRTYRATGRTRYLDAAAQTATYLSRKVGAEGCHLGDAYRKPNPISSSWVVLSLLDFAKASNDRSSEEVALRCADALLARLVRNERDPYRHGRFGGALSSSGNGWIAEVISEVHLHCRARGLERCERFRDAAVAAVRLLAQYTYSPENAFVAKNPDAAIGGLFWSPRDRYVRTDSVCHAMNAYLNVIDFFDGRLELPEPPLAERLFADAAAAPHEDDAPGDLDE